MERTGYEQWKPREVARLLALVETERRYYQEMVAALPVALAVLASDRAIVSANKAFRRLVNLTGEELRQRHIEQILPSDELMERIRSAHVHGDTGVFSIGMGERRFRMSATPIRSWEDDMQPETLLAILPEASPADESAGASTAGAGRIPQKPAPDLSEAPAVFWQADPESFAFTHVDGAAEEILGYPASHWLAEPLFFSERIHADDREEVLRLYRSVVHSGGTASAEFRAVHASGALLWRRETVTAGSAKLSGVMTAIGERRQLESQARQAGRIDALRALSSRLTHDLNNPLMIISGYTEDLLNALPAGDPARGDLTEILNAAARIRDIAGNLLAVTRSQAQPPSKIAVGEVLAALEPKLGEISSDVGIAFPDGAVWTFADAGQLGEAITALAASAAGSGASSRLTLTCVAAQVTERLAGATLAPGSYARIDILAPGNTTLPPGNTAPAADPHRILESILPGSPVLRAYLNIRQWGGDMAFAADAEKGTGFTIFLPYAEAPFVEPLPDQLEEQRPEQTQAEVEPEEIIETFPVEPEPAPSQPEPEPSLGTVLVVEDEPGIRGLVRKILRREHYEVLEAGSGEEAMADAAAQDVPIDLLLTDVMLPGMGGRELAEALSAMNPGLKVVYVSGFTDDEQVRAGEFPPGSKFLQKPFTLSALVGAVKEALEP